METTEVYVFGVRRMDYVNKETQKEVKGIKVFYTDIEREINDNMKGYNPLSAWLDYDKFEQFKNSQIPGRYKMNYELKLDAGKPKIAIKDFEFINTEVEVFS
jgi:hypothetical protein